MRSGLFAQNLRLTSGILMFSGTGSILSTSRGMDSAKRIASGSACAKETCSCAKGGKLAAPQFGTAI